MEYPVEWNCGGLRVQLNASSVDCIREDSGGVILFAGATQVRLNGVDYDSCTKAIGEALADGIGTIFERSGALYVVKEDRGHYVVAAKLNALPIKCIEVASGDVEPCGWVELHAS